jgi:hypothetical protein
MIEKSLVLSEAAGDRLRSPRNWFAGLALLLVVAGFALLVIGAWMPAYTDPVVAERIRSGLECQPGIPNTDENRRCDDQLWHRAMNTLRTNKWRLIDGGGGLLASGLTMAVFFGASRRKSWRQILTPGSSLSILALAGLAWLMQIPAYALLFVTELTRGYYPHWSDSIAIPMQSMLFGLFLLFLPYMGIWLVFVVGARLPVSIFSTIPGRPLLNAFWTTAAAMLLLLTGLVLVGAILEGAILMVPFLWLTLWLTLCARAAALTRHQPGSAKERAQAC